MIKNKIQYRKYTIMDQQEAGLYPVINATRHQKFKNILINLIVDKCNKIIVETGYTGFQKLDQQDKRSRIDSLFALCVEQRFAWMTFSDLTYLIGRGLIGEYGEFYDLTPKELNRWIKSYHQSNIDAIQQRYKVDRSNDNCNDQDIDEAINQYYQKAIDDILYLKKKHGQLTYKSFFELDHDFDLGSLFVIRLMKLKLIDDPNLTEVNYFKEFAKDMITRSSNPFAVIPQSVIDARTFKIGRLSKLATLVNNIDDFQKWVNENGIFKEKQQSRLVKS